MLCPVHLQGCTNTTEIPAIHHFIGMSSFFMMLVEYIIDDTFEVYTKVSSSCLAQLTEHLSSTSHHTGPLTATLPVYGDLPCRTKTGTFRHLKLSVLLGVFYSDFLSHSVAFSQTQPQASCATCGPTPTATSPTTTLTSTRLYCAMMAILSDNRWLQRARAGSQLSSAAKINIFGAVLEELRVHLGDELLHDQNPLLFVYINEPGALVHSSGVGTVFIYYVPLFLVIFLFFFDVSPVEAGVRDSLCST